MPIVVTCEGTLPDMTWKPLIWVSLGAGGAMISGQFFDRDGKIVAVLKNNKPVINPLNSFDVERPDDSTLIVRDQSNTEVLNIRFVAPAVFSFTGTIRSPDGAAEAVITKSYVEFTKGAMTGKFFGMTVIGGSALVLGKNASAVGFSGFHNKSN
jgi:hypothetical protein